MENNPKPYEIYEHFKGNKYQVITLAQDSENGEEMVVYQALYGDYKMYVRPLSMFLDRVDEEKYPEKKGKYRFTKVSGADNQKEEADFKEEEEVKAETEASKVTEEKEKRSGYLEVKEEAEQPEAVIDPMVLDFLDADTYEERLNILAALHHRITDDMINTMAIAVDVEIEEGPIEERYEELKNCLITFQKYQCSRIR